MSTKKEKTYKVIEKIEKELDILNKKAVEEATNEFARRVTEDNGMGKEERGEWITECFSKEARLRGTVSAVTRTFKSKPDITSYFADYFSRSVQPELFVKNANYDIVKIADGLYANYAYVQFNTSGSPVTAEMSFIFQLNKNNNKWEILLLDSNPVYNDVPKVLVEQGDVFTYWNLEYQPYGNL